MIIGINKEAEVAKKYLSGLPWLAFFLIFRSWLFSKHFFVQLSNKIYPAICRTLCVPWTAVQTIKPTKSHVLWAADVRANPTFETITSHFGIVFEETWAGKSQSYYDFIFFFEKLRFHMFSVHTKIQIWRVFWKKAPFSIRNGLV